MKLVRFFSCAGLVAFSITLLSGCATTFKGPSRYVGYYTDDKIKTANQSSLTTSKVELQSTYDDEYEYDEDGHIVKHVQTEYFDLDSRKPKYAIWKTEFTVVGGVPLPSQVSINDVPYIEVEYSLLSCDAKGEVLQANTERNFTQYYRKLLNTYPVYWAIDLDEYPVDFEADGKFVVKKWGFTPYGGYQENRFLTLGYDNVVLKKYSYSHEKLMEGLKKSYAGSMVPTAVSTAANELKNSNYSFEYEWSVINGKICQTKVSFDRTYIKYSVHFVADVVYNEAGQRTSEVWSVAQSSDAEKYPPIVIFRQTFTY